MCCNTRPKEITQEKKRKFISKNVFHPPPPSQDTCSGGCWDSRTNWNWWNKLRLMELMAEDAASSQGLAFHIGFGTHGAFIQLFHGACQMCWCFLNAASLPLVIEFRVIRRLECVCGKRKPPSSLADYKIMTVLSSCLASHLFRKMTEDIICDVFWNGLRGKKCESEMRGGGETEVTVVRCKEKSWLALQTWWNTGREKASLSPPDVTGASLLAGVYSDSSQPGHRERVPPRAGD